MTYLGSKRRLVKDFVPIFTDIMDGQGIDLFIDAFVGGGNMIDSISSKYKRRGYDINPHTIYALKDIRDNPELLPDIVTEQEYKEYRKRPPESISSWVRFVCSFSGKFDGGFARGKKANGDNRNYAAEGKRNALKQSPLLQGVALHCSSYEDIFSAERALIYCDIPYRGVTKYKGINFDYEKFYDWCRKMSKEHVVFVSEYSMPPDFKCVFEKEINVSIDSNREKNESRTEKLFTL